MSAQLLICEFAVFTCVSFFFTDVSRDLHGSLACSLSRPLSVYINPTTHQKNMLMMMMTINLSYTQLRYQYNDRKYILYKLFYKFAMWEYYMISKTESEFFS